jgi:ABC-type protease/lipase transport system fused ATPase/permease subunit
MSKARKRVECRACGDWGYEAADDPCPGLCPACMEQVLLESVVEALEDRWGRAMTARTCVRRQVERLRAIGMTEAAQQRYVRQAEIILADEFAAESRAN